MSTLAADTWGIAGPTFLGLYALLAAVATIAAVVGRRQVGRRDTATPAASLTPTQVAYLRGGDRLAVATALGQLRASGAVDDHALPVGRTTTVSDPVETAVLAALRTAKGPTSRQLAQLTRQHRVQTTLQQMRRDLTARGLVRTPSETTRVGAWSILVWAVFGLGVARIVAGATHGKPTGFLTLEAGVVLVIAAALTVPSLVGPRPAARAAVAAAKDANPHLDPQLHPSWATYGATGAGMSIALFGASAMLLAEPAFADTVAVKQLTGSSSGGSSGDGGGSSCSSGCGGGCGG